MYRCHLEFYLINCQPEVLETLRELPPLEAFNHSFLDSREPREAPLARADVLLAAPQGGEEAVRALAEGMKDSARLILLADKEQIALLEDSLSLADEVWTLPMTRKELVYRFTATAPDAAAPDEALFLLPDGSGAAQLMNEE